MQVTAIALVSTLIYTFAAAETFDSFPTSELSCSTLSGTATYTVEAIEDAARTAKDGTPNETSGSNIATVARCQQQLPYFSTSVEGTGGTSSLTFVYDESTDTYTMCGIFTEDVNGDGYSDACA